MTALDILRNANDGIDRIIAERDEARAEVQEWRTSAMMRSAEADELRNTLAQLCKRVAEYENFIDAEGARTLKIEKERDTLHGALTEMRAYINKYVTLTNSERWLLTTIEATLHD